MKNKTLTFFLIAAASSIATLGQAAALADDNASNAPYADGWQSSDNGGSGFGAWALSVGTSGGGHYIGATGEGPDPSFGLFSGGNNAGEQAFAERQFTGGALVAGQTFSIDLGNTGVDSGGGEIGLNLIDGTLSVFTLKFVGGQTNWQLNDGGSDFSSGQAFAANTELAFSFTYEGGNNYSYTFGSGSGSNFTANNTISGIDGFRLFTNEQGTGENFGANNMSVVPEPSTLAMYGLTGLAAVGVLLFKRRKR